MRQPRKRRAPLEDNLHVTRLRHVDKLDVHTAGLSDVGCVAVNAQPGATREGREVRFQPRQLSN